MRARLGAVPRKIRFFFWTFSRATWRFFFGRLCLMEWTCKLWSTMQNTDKDQEETEISAELSAALSADKPKTAPRLVGPRKRGASRQPGRPHKRLQVGVLESRTEQLRKKLEVLVAKRILVAERLDAYEQEVALRKAAEEAKA